MKKQTIDILRASARLFHQKGFKATTLQEIATEVNMEAPSLYNHIASKQDILSQLLLRGATKFTEEIQSINLSSLSGIDRLEKVIELHIFLSRKYPDTMSLMRADYIHLKEDVLKDYLVLKDEYESQFTAIIDDCIDEGQIVAKNKDLIIFTLLSTLSSIYAWIAKHENYNPIELQSELKQYLLSGIKLR